MADIPWKIILEIIAFILKKIAEGMGEGAALNATAAHFHLPISEVQEIWKEHQK